VGARAVVARRYTGALADSHIRAVIRAALLANGFDVAPEDVVALRREWQRAGAAVRDRDFRASPPSFGDPDALVGTAYLAEHLPVMLGFGYEQGTVLHRLSFGERPGGDRVGIVSAAFSAGIALLDTLVDELDEEAAVFELMTEELVHAMFDLRQSPEDELAIAYASASRPELRALCFLVGVCTNGFRDLYRQSANAHAWRALRDVVARLYTVQRALAERTASDAREKSVLPFVVVQRLVALSSRTPPAADAEVAAVAIGEAVCLVDDLVDVLDDLSRGVPSTVVLALPDAGTRPDGVSDLDIYEVIAAGAARLAASLGDESLPDAATRRFARTTIASWVGWPAARTEPRRVRIPAGAEAAARRAVDVLVAAHAAGYPDLAHRLSLPRLVDGMVVIETRPALTFPRTVVLDGLLDAHEGGLQVPRPVLNAEAMAILRAKHPRSGGGWNYIPEVHELPPDADDLAAVTHALCRVGGGDLAQVADRPLALVLEDTKGSPRFSTWIFDPSDDPTLTAQMQDYIALTHAEGVHPDVVANLLNALLVYDPDVYRPEIEMGIAYLEEAQTRAGSWNSRWYAGPFYATFRAATVFGAAAPKSPAIARARAFLLSSQRADGSWGSPEGDALATAFATLALAATRDEADEVARGVEWLLAQQVRDGSWPSSTFIEFPHPGDQSRERYGHRLITTAFCLKAILALARDVRAAPRPPEEGSDSPPGYGGWS
jgi:Squalene-hopene cyclase C-terminal domain